MYKKNKKISCLFPAIALVMMSATTINIASAAQTKIYVDPPKVMDLTLTQGKNFTINVTVTNVEEPGLYAYQFKLYYDKTILNATSVNLPPGHFLTPTLASTNIFVTELKVYHDLGYVSAAVTLMSDEPGKTGSGTLVTITFNVTGIGSSTLDLKDIILLDPNLQEIPHEVVDGQFSNKPAPPPAKLSVHPPSIRDPALVPNQNFTIDITIAEVENLYGYEFKLSYNTSVLDCVNVTIHTVQNETNFTPQTSEDEVAGTIWVNVTYHSPAKPIATYPPLILVTIKFQVTALGESILHLYDTNLVDQLGQLIGHETSDGYFSNLITRDLAILDVIPSRTHAYEKFVVGARVYESIIKITVIVRNEGGTTETFDVSTYYDDTLIGTQTVTDLNPDANATLTFSWNTTGLPLYVNYTIKAHAHEVIGEINTGNNIYLGGKVIITMFGDTNKDKKGDILDVAEAAKAFGSYIGHKRWNPNVDLDNNNRISVIDIVLIAMNFGRTS
jgi:hypothetical protein